MKSITHSLRMLLGCAALAGITLILPAMAQAASCGRAPFAAGPHALAGPARSDAGMALALGTGGSIVGLWHTVYTSGGVTAFESFDQWHADGNEFEVADLQLGSMCQGTWVKTAPRTVRLFHVGWNFDPTGVTLVGYFTETQIDTVSVDGLAYDGTFVIQNFDLSGHHIVGQDLIGTVHATRLTVP